MKNKKLFIDNLKNSKERKMVFSLVALIGIATIILSTSFAFFQKQDTIHNINMIVGTLDYEITSSELDSNKTVTIPKNSEVDIPITVKSINTISSKYEVYYQLISPSTLPSDVEIGYLNTSQDTVSGTINSNQTKTMTLKVVNDSTSDIAIKIGVEGGLINNEFVLSKGTTLNKSLADSDMTLAWTFTGSGTAPTKFPTASDGYIVTNTVCDGGEATWNNDTWALEVKSTTKKKLACNLTLKVAPIKPVAGSAAEKIMNLAATNANELRIDQHEATGQQNFVTTEYRYYGATPNNYVTFNNEPWRIIGVFDVDDGTGKIEKRVKIIRDQSIDNMAWDSNGENEWPTSTLNTYLNGEYFTSLSSTAQSMIGNSVYYLGAPTYNTTKDATYNGERGTTVYSGRSTKTTSKIALMYLSDYLYASPATCAKTSGTGSFNTTGCYDKDYLFNNAHQWTLSPLSFDALGAFLVYSGGDVSNYNVIANNGVRPVTYLTSNIVIESGTGTSSDPFILK